MSKELRHIISNLLAESSHFNANDVLVNARIDHRGLFFIEGLRVFKLDEFPKRILADSRANMKESGVNTLCFARGILQLELNGKEVHSPILLTPISASIDRIQQTVSFQEIDDASFINPFVLGHFREKFNLTIPSDILASTEMDSLVHYFQSHGLKLDQGVSVIGNFHHHRYQVLKELEELQQVSELNPAIGMLFGEENASLPESDNNRMDLTPIAVGSSNLFPADTDHESVFKTVSSSHVVIQGPPGTGKSQVICNLIGKALSSSQTILAVSEKRAALDVIVSKLSQFNLDILSFVAGSDRQSHHFLESLKKTWDFFESYTPSTDINLQLSDQYEDHLQMTLDMLKQADLIGGVSFHEFLELSKGKNFDPTANNGSTYSSKAPSISEFIKSQTIVQRVFELGIQQNLSYLRKKTLVSDDFLNLDQRINTWQEQLNSLQSIFSLETWDDLSRAMKEAATCQVFENELFKKYSAIFTPESKEQKQFIRLAKQFVGLSGTTEIGSEWKTYPSLVEAESLQHQIKQGTFFERRSAKRRWKQLSNLPFTEVQFNLEERIKAGEKEEKLNKCLAQLQRLGLGDPSAEIEQIQHAIPLFSEERWQTYSAIPLEHRAKTTVHHKALNDIYHELNSAFRIEGKINLSNFLEGFKTQLPIILAERKNILQLNESEILSLRGCSTFESYEALVLGSNYTVFKERFPAFSSFEPKAIKEKVNSILAAQSSEAQIHAKHLLDNVHRQFSAHHLLLNTPAAKLDPSQKALKKELKKGKSILIKEFGKTRSHPTLRELFQSEARHWISMLKPIWLSNPSSLAKCFPMEQNCFDLVIFDEASQIPIQHALGAIQRSKRIVVAGDEHQMGPSNYFQSGPKEITDLLHQASYYFPKVPLLHHYRSVHPELIAFSNKHFYEGKLSAYPSVHSSKRPITRHFIENAVFIDRVNELEAKAIASHISIKLKQTKSIGIVAFSEEQLACIWKQLDSEVQEKLRIHQDTYGGFFKAVENVQGDECDFLIIGFGYAPNETGDFHLRFGPMNTANGRKRLNVLLTRARESIDFFCSVRSSDFKLSDNESINLLRQWIAFAESDFAASKVQFPYGLTPKIEGETLTFDRIQEYLPNSREVATLQSVLESRGWNVSYA